MSCKRRSSLVHKYQIGVPRGGNGSESIRGSWTRGEKGERGREGGVVEGGRKGKGGGVVVSDERDDGQWSNPAVLGS